MSTQQSMHKNAFSPTDQQLIRKFVIGGAGLGSSAALVTALANHFKQMQEESERQKTKDDHVLRIKVPGVDKSGSVAGSLAMTGGALSTLLSYAAIANAYQNIKRKQLQKQLDAAQDRNLDLVRYEGESEKQGSEGKPMGVTEALLSSPLALSLLLGLGSASATNYFLNKTYPTANKPKQIGPKRLMVDVEDPDEELVRKSSSALEDDQLELVARLLLSGMDKKADNDFLNLVAAYAEGRADEVRDVMLNCDVETGLDAIKNASVDDLDPRDLSMACAAVVRDPLVGPVAKTLIAAEYHDFAPGLCHKAASMSEDSTSALACLAGVMGVQSRRDAFESEEDYTGWESGSKAAASLLDVLSLLGPGALQGLDEEEDPVDAETAGDTAVDESAEVIDTGKQEDEDIVDTLLSGKKETANGA